MQVYFEIKEARFFRIVKPTEDCTDCESGTVSVGLGVDCAVKLNTVI